MAGFEEESFRRSIKSSRRQRGTVYDLCISHPRVKLFTSLMTPCAAVAQGIFCFLEFFSDFKFFHEIFLTKPGNYEFFQAKKFEIRNIFRKDKKSQPFEFQVCINPFFI